MITAQRKIRTNLHETFKRTILQTNLINITKVDNVIIPSISYIIANVNEMRKKRKKKTNNMKNRN